MRHTKMQYHAMCSSVNTSAMQHLSQWVGEPVAYRKARQTKVGRALHAADRRSLPTEPQPRTSQLRTACLLLHLQDEVAWEGKTSACQGT